MVLTSALDGTGVAEALAAARQCERKPVATIWAGRLREMLRERVLERFPQGMFETAGREIADRQADPYTVIENWLERFIKK